MSWVAASVERLLRGNRARRLAHRCGGAAEPDWPVGEPRHLGRGGQGLQRDRARPRPSISEATIQSFGKNMFGNDFVFSVTRDFVKNCGTPLYLQPGTDKPHPANTSEEIAALAPNIEVQKDWRAPAPGSANRSSACTPSWSATPHAEPGALLDDRLFAQPLARVVDAAKTSTGRSGEANALKVRARSPRLRSTTRANGPRLRPFEKLRSCSSNASSTSLSMTADFGAGRIDDLAIVHEVRLDDLGDELPVLLQGDIASADAHERIRSGWKTSS